MDRAVNANYRVTAQCGDVSGCGTARLNHRLIRRKRSRRKHSKYGSIVTVTKEQTKRCRWCGAGFVINPGSGRPRKYCKRSHRQRHYEAKQLADRRGLGEGELLIEASKLDELRDTLFAFEAACEDVETDLEIDASPDALRAAVSDLLAAARPLIQFRVEPKADS